jgi:hypothetical protein
MTFNIFVGVVNELAAPNKSIKAAKISASFNAPLMRWDVTSPPNLIPTKNSGSVI